jgi:hypothetical protein
MLLRPPTRLAFGADDATELQRVRSCVKGLGQLARQQEEKLLQKREQMLQKRAEMRQRMMQGGNNGGGNNGGGNANGATSNGMEVI